MKKGFILLCLLAVSGVCFAQPAVSIAIADLSGDDHNAGDNSTITGSNSGFNPTCGPVTYSNWQVSSLSGTSTQTFVFTPASTGGPYAGVFNNADTYTVTADASNPGTCIGGAQTASGTADVTITAAGTPVVVANQNIVLAKTQAKLSWSTYSEFNNDYFTVTRSSNGVDFETIGTVKGKGNTKLTQYYTFEDKSPLAGVSYYQIVQHDLDGSATALSALPLKNLKNNLNVVKLSPNPVNESSVIEFEAAHEGSVELKVFDLMGRSVISQLVSVEKGLNSVNLDMSFLSNGLYQVSLTDGVNNVIEKVYKN